MFGRGKSNEQEVPLEDLPMAPYPEYTNPKGKGIDRRQQMPQPQVQVYTRPQAQGDIFKMEKLTQGKNNFVILSVMASEKSVERFKLGRTMLVQ